MNVYNDFGVINVGGGEYIYTTAFGHFTFEQYRVSQAGQYVIKKMIRTEHVYNVPTIPESA